MTPDQNPRGPKDLKCPFWRKPMSQVCHTCPLWTHVLGTNPQTGADIDRWDCAIALSVLMSAEVAQKTNQVAAVLESSRNEIVGAVNAMDETIRQVGPTPNMKSIEGKAN